MHVNIIDSMNLPTLPELILEDHRILLHGTYIILYHLQTSHNHLMEVFKTLEIG